jgi:hypothetical protein
MSAQWVRIDITTGAPLLISSYTWTLNDDVSSVPSSWVLQGSNNNGLTWDVVDSRVSAVSFVATGPDTGTYSWLSQSGSTGSTMTFTFTATTLTKYYSFRLVVTSAFTKTSSKGRLALSSMYFTDELGQKLPPQVITAIEEPKTTVAWVGSAGTAGTFTYTASASSGANPQFAFDKSAATLWISGASFNTTTGTGSAWIRLAATQLYATTYSIQASTNVSRAPRAWTLQGSADGALWNTIDTQSAQSFTSAQIKSYSIQWPGTYNYYQLTITSVQPANNGTAEIAEFKFTTTSYDVPATNSWGVYTNAQSNTYSISGAPLSILAVNPTGVIGEWVQFSVPSNIIMGGCDIVPHALFYPTSMTILGSLNGVWKTITSKSGMTSATTTITTNAFEFFDTFRFVFTASAGGIVSIKNINIRDILGERRCFVIPFCLQTNSLYHTGSINFSNIDRFALSNNLPTQAMYGIGHNTLQIENGHAKLLY